MKRSVMREWASLSFRPCESIGSAVDRLRLRGTPEVPIGVRDPDEEELVGGSIRAGRPRKQRQGRSGIPVSDGPGGAGERQPRRPGEARAPTAAGPLRARHILI